MGIPIEGRVPRTTDRGARSSVPDPMASGPRFEGRGPRSSVLGPWNLIGRTAEGWRRRMEAGEFSTVRDLAIAVNLAERHVSRQLQLAYPAPDSLK
jgi:hypothetical protein